MLNITTPKFGQSMALIKQNVIDDLRKDLDGVRNISFIPAKEDKVHKYITVVAWGDFNQLYSRDSERFSEYTKKSRESFPEDIDFGIDLFRTQPGFALFFILKMINEYYFWFKDEESGIHPELSDYSTYKLLNDLNSAAGSNYNSDYEWVHREFSLSIARDFVFSNEFVGIKN